MRKELWHCKPRMSRFALLMLICSVAFGCSYVTSAVETAPKRCAILFTGTIARMRTKVDPKYVEKLERMGYQIDARDLNQVDETVLAQFNVVVLYRPPVRGDMRNSQVFKRCTPMLVNYVRNGGGMLIFADLRYEAEKNLNELLREFDAQLLPERIWDENYFRQMRYLQLAFARTRQIAHHPAMKDVHEIIFPLEVYHGIPGAMARMEVGQQWQVLIATEETGRAVRRVKGKLTITAKGRLPLLAVRELGNGRIALFPTHTTHYIHAGYHRIREGICLDEGNGFKLLCALYDWLAKPSLMRGTPGGFVQRKPLRPQRSVARLPDGVATTDPYQRIALAKRRELKAEVAIKPKRWNVYRGIIGVYTKRTIGWGDVRDFCERARKLGYQFIAFTDRFDMLTRNEWEDLVRKCSDASDDKFIAIPGIEYENMRGTKFIALNLPRYPDREWLTPDGRFIKNQPGFYFGLDWVPTFLVLPMLAHVPPWFAKFYSGLELFAYSHGNRYIGDARKWYLICQRSDYNLIPIACHRVYAPQELDYVQGYRTYILAPSVNDISKGLRYFWYAQRRTFVSSGPIIREWWIENGRAGLRDEQWRVLIDVESNAPLTKLIIWDGEKPYRIFMPSAKRFTTQLIGYHDRQRALTLEVYDANGGHAITGALYVSDVRHSTYMCTDLQNTLNSMSDIDADGNLTYFGVLGGWVTGWDGGKIGILVPERELFPEGLDYVVRGFDVGFSHSIHTREGKESAVSRREITFGCGDCNVLTSYFNAKLLPGSYPVPTEFADTICRLIAFTPKPYSDNIILVEHEVHIKRTVNLESRDGPELGLIRIALPASSFERIAYINETGEKITIMRSRNMRLPQVILKPGAYIAAFPDFYGAVAVYALDGEASVAMHGDYKSGGRLEIGLEMPNAQLRRGAVLRTRHLLVRGRFGEMSGRCFDVIRDVYGLDGAPAYRATVEHGKLVSTHYILHMRAVNAWAQVRITNAQLPNPLPVIVEGLNDRWDTALLDVETGKWRRVGVWNDKAMVTLDISKPRHVIIGNILKCDDPSIWLALIRNDGKWYIEAHNPDAKQKHVRVSTARWFKCIPYIHRSIAIPGGSSKRIALEER